MYVPILAEELKELNMRWNCHIGLISLEYIVGQLSIRFVLTAYRLSDTVKQPVRHFSYHYLSVRDNF